MLDSIDFLGIFIEHNVVKIALCKPFAHIKQHGSFITAIDVVAHILNAVAHLAQVRFNAVGQFVGVMLEQVRATQFLAVAQHSQRFVGCAIHVSHFTSAVNKLARFGAVELIAVIRPDRPIGATVIEASQYLVYVVHFGFLHGFNEALAQSVGFKHSFQNLFV